MPLLATASSGSTGYSGYLILLLPLVLLGFLFWSQRRRQKATQQQQSSVTVGSEVATTSGIYGIVTAVQEPVVAVEVAPGVTLHVDRRAVLPRASLAPRAAAGTTPTVPAGRYGELPSGASTGPTTTAVSDPAGERTTYGDAIDHQQGESDDTSRDKD